MPLQLKLSPNHHFALLKTKQRLHNSVNAVVNLVTFKDTDSLREARELSFLQIRNPLTRRAPSPAPPYATQNDDVTITAGPGPGPGGAEAAPSQFNNASFLSGDGVYDSPSATGGVGKRQLGSFATTASSTRFSSVSKGTGFTTPSESRTSSRGGKGATTTSSANTSHQMQPDERLPTIHVGPHATNPNFHDYDDVVGVKGCLTVFAAWLCFFCSIGLITAMATFQSEFQTYFFSKSAHNNTTTSWIFTLPIFLTFILYRPLILLIDTLSRRKVLFPSSLLVVLGLCMLSLSHEYYQIILSHGVCTGIGIAGVFAAGSTVLRNRRPLVISTAITGASAGGVVFPIMVSKLISHTGGFKSGIRWSALVAGVLLIIANLFSFPSLSSQPPSGTISNTSSSTSSFNTSQKHLFRNIIYVFACFLLSWGVYIPIYFLPTSSTPSSLSEYLIPIMAAGSIPGILLSNVFSSSLPILTATSFLSGCFVLAIWYPSNTQNTLAVIIIFALAYGFSASALVSSMVSAAITQRAGGKVVCLIAMAVGGLTGIPIASVLLDKVGFKGLIGFTGGSMLAGSLLVGLVLLMVRREKRSSAIGNSLRGVDSL